MAWTGSSFWDDVNLDGDVVGLMLLVDPLQAIVHDFFLCDDQCVCLCEFENVFGLELCVWDLVYFLSLVCSQVVLQCLCLLSELPLKFKGSTGLRCNVRDGWPAVLVRASARWARQAARSAKPTVAACRRSVRDIDLTVSSRKRQTRTKTITCGD